MRRLRASLTSSTSFLVSLYRLLHRLCDLQCGNCQEPMVPAASCTQLVTAAPHGNGSHREAGGAGIITLLHVKCISWNHGYNTGTSTGAIEHGHHLLDHLGGDVLLLQETTIPEWAPNRGYASFLKVLGSRLWGRAYRYGG